MLRKRIGARPSNLLPNSVETNSRIIYMQRSLSGGETIIRTVHSVMPETMKGIREGDNYFVSDIPYDYLNLYANAVAVITNRVHAAVASVSYGTPVYLNNKTPRGSILERIHCDGVYRELHVSDTEYLEAEKKKYENTIRQILT